MRSGYVGLVASAALLACAHLDAGNLRSAATLSARLVLKQPITARCEQSGLKGCGELVEGALLHAEGRPDEGNARLKVGAALNATEEVHAFARALRGLAPIMPAGEVTKKVLAAADFLAAFDPKRSKVRAGREGDLRQEADVQPVVTGMVDARAGGSACPSLPLGSSICVTAASGPLMLTDLHLSGGCSVVALARPIAGGGATWLIGLDNDDRHVTGARLVVGDGEQLLVTGDNDVGPCLLTWSAQKLTPSEAATTMLPDHLSSSSDVGASLNQPGDVPEAATTKPAHAPETVSATTRPAQVGAETPVVERVVVPAASAAAVTPSAPLHHPSPPSTSRRFTLLIGWSYAGWNFGQYAVSTFGGVMGGAEARLVASGAFALTAGYAGALSFFPTMVTSVQAATVGVRFAPTALPIRIGAWIGPAVGWVAGPTTSDPTRARFGFSAAPYADIGTPQFGLRGQYAFGRFSDQLSSSLATVMLFLDI